MEFLKRVFRKSPQVSLGSKIFGVIMMIIAVGGQIFFSIIVIQDIAQGFPTRAEVVAKVAEKTDLPVELVNLYTQSILAEESSLMFAPIGKQVEIKFNEVESVLAWGGINPVFRILLQDEEYLFYGETETSQTSTTVDNPTELVAKPLDVSLSVPPPNWGEDLNSSSFDVKPFLTFTVTQASPEILHTPLQVRASFELKYAKRSDAYHFVNYRLDADRNYQETEIVIVTEHEGALLEESQKELNRAKHTLGDALEDLFGLTLVMAFFFLLGLWWFRGGLDRLDK